MNSYRISKRDLLYSLAAATVVGENYSWACPPPTGTIPPPAGAPAHIVICLMENTSYSSVVGNSSAPYINGLIARGCLLTNYFAVSHPSEPNYFALFSGSTQGITDDGTYNYPTTPTISGQLHGAGRTFFGYPEQPYQRHHNPWESFGDGQAYEVDWSSFPTNLTQLPTFAWISPNNNDNGHDTDLPTSDTWLRNNVDRIVTYCEQNNGLFILVWDEDDQTTNANHVVCIMVGQQVKPGSTFTTNVTHYSTLRMIEDFYGLSHLANAATATPIVLPSRTTATTESATATFVAVLLSGGRWQYTLTLKNTGTTTIGTFWIAWVPGQGYLPSLPTVTASPSGWTGVITDGPPPTDGYSIQWVNPTPMQASASVTGFVFTTTDSPTTLLGNSAIHAGIPILTTFVYQTTPLSDAGYKFVITSAATTPTASLVASGLDVPWEICFLPDGTFLVTQRDTFSIRHCSSTGTTLGSFSVPNTVTTSGEGGLMGLSIDPNFATNGFIYICHTRTYSGGYTSGGNEVIRYTLNASANTISGGTTLLTYGSGQFHNGGALAIGPDGCLYITTGNGTNPNSTSQVLTGAAINDGKILRINLDGTKPADNPFNTDGTKATSGDGKTRSAVWTWGHRNPQGICWDANGNCWGSENGPTGEAFGSFTGIKGNDKINLIRKGINYGFPLAYGAGTATDSFGVTTQAPVFTSGNGEVWAPEGIVAFNGSIFFCALGGLGSPAGTAALDQFTINAVGGATSGITKRLTDGHRKRAASIGPDGFLYYSTSDGDGRGSQSAGTDVVNKINLVGWPTSP